MAYKSYKKKSEVAHHRSKTLGVDVATAFEGLLTLLTTFGAFKTIQEFFKLSDVEIIVSTGLANGYRASHLFNW